MKLVEIKNPIDQQQLDEIVEILQQHCDHYLTHNRPTNDNDILWRGLGSILHDPTHFVDEPPKDRKPVDTPLTTHNILNEWFESKFNIKARSETVFVGGRSIAAGYASVSRKMYAIIPFGSNYSAIYSPNVSDLYASVVPGESEHARPGDALIEHTARRLSFGHDNWIPKMLTAHSRYDPNFHKQLLFEFLEHDAQYQHTTNLKKAAESQNEIMLICDKYIAVHHSLIWKALNQLKDQPKDQ